MPVEAMVGHVCLMCWPICATMLGQTVTSQRFCRLLAPSAAQAVSNTFSRHCGTPHPVTLVFERSGTGILLHAAEAGGGECSACSNPATDSPVPLVLTIKLNGPMLAERTTLSMLPTITWEQGTSCRQSTVPSMPGNCSARRSRSASFVRDSTAEAELFSRGGYQRCCWRPLHAWLRSRRSELLTPLHRCVRRPTTGVDAFARIWARPAANERSLPESVVPAHERWRES